MNEITITPDTTLYTWSATNDGEGSLLESVLGNRSCGDYAREFAHLTEAQDLAQTCAWFADYPEGIYLSEAEARADWENRPAEYYSILDSRTPREIRTVILNGAAEDDYYQTYPTRAAARAAARRHRNDTWSSVAPVHTSSVPGLTTREPGWVVEFKSHKHTCSKQPEPFFLTKDGSVEYA